VTSNQACPRPKMEGATCNLRTSTPTPRNKQKKNTTCSSQQGHVTRVDGKKSRSTSLGASKISEPAVQESDRPAFRTLLIGGSRLSSDAWGDGSRPAL